MLDIVMVAHKPNYKRLAYRGVDANGAGTIKGSLPSGVSRVPVAGKVILSLEGGKHQDFEAAEAYLKSQNLDWQIVHNDEVTSYSTAMMNGLLECKSGLVAIIPAWCEITDDMWVQRTMWPLQRDQQALLCTTWDEQGPAKDLAPHVAKPRVWPGGEIIIARRAPLVDLLRLIPAGVNFYDEIAKAAVGGGWRIWAHPGMRFRAVEHKEHESNSKTRSKV